MKISKMKFKSDNYDEHFKNVAFLTWISIPFYSTLFSHIGILSKFIFFIIGSIFIMPVITFIYYRYEIIFEEDGIHLNYLNKKRKNLILNYTDILKVTLVSNRIHFKFKLENGKSKSYFVENVIKELPEFIQFLRLKNDKIFYHVKYYDDNVLKIIQKELKKKLPVDQE